MMLITLLLQAHTLLTRYDHSDHTACLLNAYSLSIERSSSPSSPTHRARGGCCRSPETGSRAWLKVNEIITITVNLYSAFFVKEPQTRIEYKLLSLIYKVLTTSQPSYLNNLISVQPPRSTRSSSVVTLSRRPTISSLKITDRSFRYASPRLWNELPDSFRQPRQSCLDSPPHSPVSSSLLLSLFITPSLFHSRLKTYLFNKSFPP